MQQAVQATTMQGKRWPAGLPANQGAAQQPTATCRTAWHNHVWHPQGDAHASLACLGSRSTHASSAGGRGSNVSASSSSDKQGVLPCLDGSRKGCSC